jgi:hypothetical protein
MRRVAFFLAVVLAAFGAQAQLDPVPPPERWRNYDGGTDNFTIRVPGIVQKRPWSDNRFPATHYLTGSVEEAFSVTVISYPRSIRGTASAPLIAERFATLMRASAGAAEPTRNEADKCGGDAPGYIIEAPLPDELNYFARVCVTADIVYKVEAVVNREKLPAALAHVRAFLDSFRTRAPLAPAAPDPAPTAAPTEPPKPAEPPNPAEPPKPAELPKPVEPPKPAEPPAAPPPPAPTVTVPMPSLPK